MAPTNSEYLGPDVIIDRKREFLLPCSYHFYRKPPQLVSGSGTVLTDSEGKTYVDFFAGVSVMSCGRCNPEIIEPVMEQIRTLQHTTSIYLTQPVVELAESLAAVLPGDLSRSFFCNSGSEANEGAMLLARVATGRRSFIALEGSLHGRTFLTSGATGLPLWRTDPFVSDAPVVFASGAEEIERLLVERGGEFAALMVEPIQGNAGIRPLPVDFFTRVAPLLKKHGVLLIADEIQTGFARTGRMFAIEHYNIVPDIITGAKALGGGFPIGFFSTTPAIASCFTRPSASTLGGNPVSCTAGLAVLDFIGKHDLVQRSAKMGEFLGEKLSSIAARHDFLSPPRGFGLMQGLEVHDQAGKPAAEMVDDILERMKDEGYLIGKNGMTRNVLAFQPPLIISEDEITGMTRALARVIQELV